MTTKALEALAEGSYLSARIYGESGLETVRFSHVSPPTSDELRYGFTMNNVHVRRFLVGGYLDIRLVPREVIAPVTPRASTLAVMAIIENDVGPKEL